MQNDTKNEPLAPDPSWRQVNSENWQSDQVSGVLSHPPAAYAKGFENGAFALAQNILAMFEGGNAEEAMKQLLSYRNGAARPARNWENEHKRN